MTDQELKDLVASLAVESAKTEAFIKETGRQQRLTEAFINETGRQQRLTDEQMKKTDEQMKKTDEQLKRTDAKLERIGIRLGSISNNQGEIAEEYFINSLKNRLELNGMKFDALISNLEIRTKDINDEFDILLVNGNTLALIEVKYKVHPNDIKKLAKKIEHIRLMPSYKNYTIYAGIAGFKIPQDALELAKQSGYFALHRKGDIIEYYTKDMKAA